MAETLLSGSLTADATADCRPLGMRNKPCPIVPNRMFPSMSSLRAVTMLVV